LGNRSSTSVEARMRRLTSGLSHTSALWTKDEDEVIREMRRQGHKAKEITKYLPSRGLGAINSRMRAIARSAGTRSLTNRRPPRVWSDADVQRMIEMRVVERKSEMEIAKELDTSWGSMRGVWWARCVKLIPRADLISLHARRRWNPAEKKHLAELYIRTTITPNDLALHFPSKTLNAVNVKISRSRFQVAREQYQAEPRDKAYGASPASH
jgi:transposase-like protein